MAEETEVIDDKTLDQEITESIRGTLADITARGAEETGLTPDAKIAEETPSTEPAVPAAAPEKPRAPDGKFAKAPKEPAVPAKADTSTPVAATASVAGAAAPEEELKFGNVKIDLARPPASWKPAAKMAWAALPENVRQEIYRREADFSNTVLNGPLKESANFGKSVREIVAPYQQMIEREGGTPERAIAETLKTMAFFRTADQPTKLAELFKIDKQFGAGLQAHFNAELRRAIKDITGKDEPSLGGAPAQTFTDPRVDALVARLQEQDNARTEEVRKGAASATEQFFAAKNAAGEPEYPFIANVSDDMSARVAEIRRANPGMEHVAVLKQAYDAAVWANPETRAVLISQQQAQAAQPTEALQKVARAKLAAAGNLPKRGAIPAQSQAGNLRLGTPESDESIRQTFRELNG